MEVRLRILTALVVFCGLVGVAAAAPLGVELFPSRWQQASPEEAGLSQSAVISAPSGRKTQVYGEDYVLEEIDFSDGDIGEVGKLDYYIDEGLEYYLDENLEVNRTRFPTKDRDENKHKDEFGKPLNKLPIGLFDDLRYSQIPRYLDLLDIFDFQKIDNTNKQPLESRLDNFNFIIDDNFYPVFNNPLDDQISSTYENKDEDMINEDSNNEENLNLGSRFGDGDDTPEDSKQNFDSNSEFNLSNFTLISEDKNENNKNVEINSLDPNEKTEESDVNFNTDYNDIDLFTVPELNDYFNIKSQLYRLKSYSDKVQEKLKSVNKNSDEIMEAVE